MTAFSKSLRGVEFAAGERFAVCEAEPSDEAVPWNGTELRFLLNGLLQQARTSGPPVIRPIVKRHAGTHGVHVFLRKGEEEALLYIPVGA